MPVASPKLHAALWYADQGYPVFPCAPGRKTPLTEHGLLDATTDADQVEAWWTQSPGANLGLRTDGLVVIDVDGADNLWLQDQPERLAQLATVPTSLTPRGGRQYMFRQPEGRCWRNTAGQLAPHVDTRADGGYIVVPPSTVGGNTYRWLDGLDLPAPEKLDPPPDWLVALLDRMAPRDAANSTAPASETAVPAGQRNATLARLAGVMRRVGMSQAEILAALLRVNIDRCHPPLHQREVERIAASIARYAPDSISVALIEDHYGQDRQQPASGPSPVRDLVKLHFLRKPVIHGLLRRGETMNVIAAPKTGKALAVDTPILTATGWLTMGELQPGMYVHAGDGSLTEVVAASEVMHGRPCYRATTRSEASIVADEQHLWSVYNNSGSAVVTTAELPAGRWGRRWLLPVAGPLERPAVKLPLDPWLLGYVCDLRGQIGRFLQAECGLRLSEEKTHITHVRDGFGFLGFDLTLAAGRSGNLVPKIHIGTKAKSQLRLRLDEAMRYRPHQESVALRIQRGSAVIRGWAHYYCIAYNYPKLTSTFDHWAFWTAVKAISRKLDIRAAKVLKQYYRGSTMAVSDQCQLERFRSIGIKLHVPGPEPYCPGGNADYETDEELEASLHRYTERGRFGQWDRKHQALHRDSYRCQSCGATVTAATSRADHIKPVNRFANFPMANALDNVQTLCPSCHAKKHRDR